MKQFITTILFIFLLSIPLLQAQEVGVKEIGQSQYIVYSIDVGDNLSQIAAIYDVTVEEILATNTHIKDENDIKINDILMIPYGQVSRASMGDEGITMHTVQKGENLFRISQDYDVAIDDIKDWNDLDDDKIKMGQELIVGVSNRKSTRKNNTKQSNYAQRTNRSAEGLIEGIYHEVEKGETLSSISRLYGVSVSELKEWNNLSGDLIEAEQLLQVVPSEELEEEADDEDGFGDAVIESEDAIATVEIEYYKVRKGDNLNRIGERYGVHPNQLKELNGLKDVNDIYVEQQLIIKKKGIAAEPHPKSETILYTVELDDKIEVLAESFDVSEDNIRYWNNLSSEDVIIKGQELKIRATPETASSYTSIIQADEELNASNLNNLQKISNNRVMTYGGLDGEDTQVDSSKVKQYTVTVLQGESLNKIAEREEVTPTQIIEWNNLDNPNHIEAGQDLILYSGLPKPKNTSNIDPRILAITDEAYSSDTDSPTKIIATHKVVSGESLYSISQKYGVTVDEILDFNNISHEDSIRRNTELKIPEHKELPPIVQNYQDGTFHLIKSGETLSKIADQYEGVTVENILKANNFDNENAIDRGLVILIPPPNSSEIDLEKIANRQLAIENAKKFDNPYLKDEYIKHLLPKGEDAVHDLFRDYAENGANDSKGISTGGNNPYNTSGTGNVDDTQGTNSNNSNPYNSGTDNNAGVSNPYNSNTGSSNPYNSGTDNNAGVSNPYNSNTGSSNPYNSGTDNNAGVSNPYNSNTGSSNPYNSNPYNSDPNSNDSEDSDATDMFMRGQADETNLLGNDDENVENNTDVQDDTIDNTGITDFSDDNSIPGNSKVIQSGYAQLMTVSGTSRKYIGLHRDAPINSVVTVTNPENNRKAYVMIIDRLTDPVDADVMIQVSESTINQLTPGVNINEKINVQIEYKLK